NQISVIRHNYELAAIRKWRNLNDNVSTNLVYTRHNRRGSTGIDCHVTYRVILRRLGITRGRSTMIKAGTHYSLQTRWSSRPINFHPDLVTVANRQYIIPSPHSRRQNSVSI